MIFAGALVLLIAVMALVFDMGQALLDRRTQQNAADSAALAGARYIPTATGEYQGLCSARTASQLADPQLKHVNTACDVAIAYLAADNLSGAVTVKYPPGPESTYSLLPDNIEVRIDGTRASFFAGIFGNAARHTGAIAVASNSSGYSLPYSLLALDPCGGSSVTGSGGVSVNGSVQVDSSCNPALKISGGGTLNSPECNTVGTYQVSGGGTGCTVMSSGMQASGDPLRELPPPSVPTNLGNIIKEPGESKNVPVGCVENGAPSSTITAPPTSPCTFNSSFAGHSYRLYPGYYPGGLKLNAGTFYMEPGIYYIGGGGVDMSGNGASITSVDAGTTTFGGGVLIYNGSFAGVTPCSGNGCTGPVNLNGSTAVVRLNPIQTTIYKYMVLFGERTSGGDITLNGASTNLQISGTIYAPNSLVTVNGNGATSLSVQLIVNDFTVKGNGGALLITYDSGKVFQLTGVGLVQ